MICKLLRFLAALYSVANFLDSCFRRNDGVYRNKLNKLYRCQNPAESPFRPQPNKSSSHRNILFSQGVFVISHRTQSCSTPAVNAMREYPVPVAAEAGENCNARPSSSHSIPCGRRTRPGQIRFPGARMCSPEVDPAAGNRACPAALPVCDKTVLPDPSLADPRKDV